MILPETENKLIDFVRDKIEICTYSQGSRSQEASRNISYYETGTSTSTASLYNRTGVHIDRTSAFLYAPGQIRYSIGFDATDGEPWLARAKAAAKYLSRQYRRTDTDVLFSQGVTMALCKGMTLLKHNWMREASLYPGLDTHLVHPDFFGVEREDLPKLEDQQCFVHTTYLSREQLEGLSRNRPDEAEILKKVERLAGTDESEQKVNWLHQVVLGGVQAISTSNPSGARGTVSVSPSFKSEFSPEMLRNLLRMDELWVVDEDRDDYTTIQLIEGEILLEGRYLHRNLTGVKGLQPFSVICPDPVPGYFWGRSEVGRVIELQDMLTERMFEIRRILKLQTREPMGFIGFQGITSAKRRALMSPDGFIQEQNPNAKIERLGPKMPENIFAEVDRIEQKFDEMGGFKPIMQGEGEAGVRAGTHANTLMRTASPKLKERAIKVERNAEQSAAIVFRLLQSKDARVFMSQQKEQFLLKQMPEDYCIEVDSHTASPALVDDARQLAFALAKAGAVGPEELIMMTHPPLEDHLISAYRERQKARQEFIAANPQLLEQGKKRR